MFILCFTNLRAFLPFLVRISVALNSLAAPVGYVVVLVGDGGHEAGLAVHVVGDDHETAVGEPNPVEKMGLSALWSQLWLLVGKGDGDGDYRLNFL